MQPVYCQTCLEHTVTTALLGDWCQLGLPIVPTVHDLITHKFITPSLNDYFPDNITVTT